MGIFSRLAKRISSILRPSHKTDNVYDAIRKYYKQTGEAQPAYKPKNSPGKSKPLPAGTHDSVRRYHERIARTEQAAYKPAPLDEPVRDRFLEPERGSYLQRVMDSGFGSSYSHMVREVEKEVSAKLTPEALEQHAQTYYDGFVPGGSGFSVSTTARDDFIDWLAQYDIEFDWEEWNELYGNI